MAHPRVRRMCLALIAFAACMAPPPAPGSSPTTSPTVSTPRVTMPAPAAPVAGPSHIVVVVMENHEYDQVVGLPDAPFLDGMVGQGVLLSKEFAVTHPSLPNYLALLGGSTFGITSDCTSCHVSASNLVDQLEASGRTW